MSSSSRPEMPAGGLRRRMHDRDRGGAADPPGSSPASRRAARRSRRDPIVPVTRSGAITRTVVCTGCDVTSAPPPVGALPVRVARRSRARNTSSCGLSASAVKAVVVIPVAFASVTLPPPIETRSGNEPATAAGSSVARAASTRLPGLNPAQMIVAVRSPGVDCGAVGGLDVRHRRADREEVVARLRDVEALRGGDGERRSGRVDRDPDARRRGDVVARRLRRPPRRRVPSGGVAESAASGDGSAARRGWRAPTRPRAPRARGSARPTTRTRHRIWRPWAASSRAGRP